MFKPWAEIALLFCNILALCIAAISTLARRSEYQDALALEKKKPGKLVFARIRAIKSVYYIAIYSLIVAIIISAFLIGFGTDWKALRQKKTSTQPTPTATPSIVTSVPIKSSVKDAWLDELDPILHKPRAFFIHEWSRYDLIQIEDTIYQHSIGICIPSDKLKAYCDRPPVGEILHNEYLEYRLSYKYKSFQFDYGIDDISFPEDVETASRCEYKIVVQSCNSKEYLGSTDNILYDSDWINYRSTVFRSTLIDVANSEAIRITVYWKFHLRTCGPIAFNIAIVNPILRGIKADTYISNPKRTQTKPDSIR